MTALSDRWTSFLRWRRRNVELTSLALLVLVVLGLWAFAELADEVLEGSTRNLDRDILLLLRAEDDPDNAPWPRGGFRKSGAI